MFEELLKKHDDLNTEMYEAISNLVSQHGGFIRTDSNERDIFCDSMYAITYDEGQERYVDERILAVAVTESGLAVYTDQSDCVTIEGMSNEDILADQDDWYPVKGGMVWINPTLVSICECIEQYID